MTCKLKSSYVESVGSGVLLADRKAKLIADTYQMFALGKIVHIVQENTGSDGRSAELTVFYMAGEHAKTIKLTMVRCEDSCWRCMCMGPIN